MRGRIKRSHEATELGDTADKTGTSRGGGVSCHAHTPERSLPASSARDGAASDTVGHDKLHPCATDHPILSGTYASGAVNGVTSSVAPAASVRTVAAPERTAP